MKGVYLMKTIKSILRTATIVSVLLAGARAEAAVALVQSMFQIVDRVYNNTDVATSRSSIVFPMLYGTAPNTIFVMVNGTLDTCKANNQSLTDLGNGVFSIIVGTGGTNNYSIHCILENSGNTGYAMVGVFEVSGAVGTIDAATSSQAGGSQEPTVNITPTITASLIVAFGSATRNDYPTSRPLLMCPNTSVGTTRMKYQYTHNAADAYNHQVRWFQRLDALGGLGASTLGMSGGFSSWYIPTPIFDWNMTAIAIHPL